MTDKEPMTEQNPSEGKVPETRRQRLRDATHREIMSIARGQIAEQGAAALSLRAIARDMGMTAPAIYRYFPSRDDLLTALILETYNDLADTLETAVNGYAQGDYRGKFLAFAAAYRHWAKAHPQDYMLIYTTSVPGYDAPDEITQPAAQRSMKVIVDVIIEAAQAGAIRPAPAIPTGNNENVLDPMLSMHLRGWSRLHGVITLEIFGHLEPIIGDADQLYQVEVNSLLTLLGL